MTSDWKLGYVLGALTGDGCTFMFGYGHSASGVRLKSRIVNITAMDREMVSGVARFCAELFSCQSKCCGPRKPDKAYSQPYYSWQTTRKSVIDALTKDRKFILPINDEQWRGFIAGFFDAEGSHLGSELVACYQKGKMPLMRTIQEIIESCNIPTSLRVSKRGITQLYVRGYPRGQKGISPQQRGLRSREVRGRFFEVFQPLIERKHLKVA